MVTDEHIIFYNNGRDTIEPTIANLLADFYRLKDWPQTKTCTAMDLHGSNKNHRRHVIYTPFYDALFHDINPRGILEFGIGSQSNVPFSMSGQPCKVGGSIRAWHSLFPNAQIFAADVDRGVLFYEDKIHSYYVDALAKHTIIDMWEILYTDYPDAKIDIIVDDAHHSADANLLLFDNSIEHLEKSGWYAIEDINRQNGNHTGPIKEWLETHDYDAVWLDIPNDTNSTNCCMVIIHKTTT